MGFDIAFVPSQAKMNAWWSSSPYFDTSLYLPGAANKSQDPNLNSAWVSAIEGQGWGLVPIWVGPQAPCVISKVPLVTISTVNPAAQGEAEAVKANKAIQSLAPGLGGTVIYYDMEYYTPHAGSSCDNTVLSFLGGWVTQMQALGYKAGVYGNVATAQVDFSEVSPSPDDAWISLSPSVGSPPNVSIWNLIPSSGTGGLCDKYSSGCPAFWSKDQRMHQYIVDTPSAKYFQTWGGVQLEIDPDIVDADVANLPSPSKGPPFLYTFTSVSPNGATTKSLNGINEMGTVDTLYGGYITGSRASQTGQIIDEYFPYFDGVFDGFGNLIYNPDTMSSKPLPMYNGQCGNSTTCNLVNGINDDGVTVGAWSPGPGVVHGLIENGSTLTSFDFPGAITTYATGIDDAGLVSGWYYDQLGVHGFLLNSVTMVFAAGPINFPGSTLTYPLGIDGYGRMVGYYYDGFNYHEFLYDENGNFSTTTSDCSQETFATGINNNGQVVEYAYPSASGYLYSQGYTSYLESPCAALNYPSSTNTQLCGINDAGEITGTYNITGGANQSTQGFYAVPNN